MNSTSRTLKPVSRHVRLSASILLLLSVTDSHAAFTGWQCTTGFWDTASCWANTLPQAGDTVAISGPSSVVTYRYTSPTPVELSFLFMYGNATLNQSQDTLRTINENIGEGASSATYNLSGGSNIVTGLLKLGILSGVQTSIGTYNLSNTGALSAGTLTVGYGGIGIFNQSGGTNTVSGAVTLGEQPTGTGTYSMTGGTLNAGSINLTPLGTASFTQNGGNVVSAGALSIGTNGVYDLQAGSLQVSTLDINTGGIFRAGVGALFSSTTINHSGGTVEGNLVNQGVYNYSLAPYSNTPGAFNGRLINQGTANFLADFAPTNGIENGATGQFSIGTARTITLNGAGLHNAGTVQFAGGILQGAGALTNDGVMTGYGTIGGSGGFTNNNQLTIAGGDLTLSNTGANVNNGTIDIGFGRQLRLDGVGLSTNGVIKLNSTASITGTGTLTINSQFTGAGVVDVNVNNTGTINAKSGNLVIGGAAFNNSGLVKNSVGSNLFVQSPSVMHTGSIEVNAAGSVVFDAAVTNSPGALVSLKGGALSTPTLTNAAGGTVSGAGTITGNMVNAGSVDLFGASSIFGNLSNQSGGYFKVRNDQTLISGHTTNNGTIETLNGKVIFEGGLTNNGALLFDPSTITASTLSVGVNGYLAETGVPGDLFIITQDLINESIRNLDWETSHTAFQFNGGAHTAGNPQFLEVAGADIGNLSAGWNNNFMFGTLRVGTSDTYVKLVDSYNNSAMCLSSYCEILNQEALYVNDLILEAGTTLDLNGLHLYVLNSFINNGGSVINGAVAVSAVPIPAAVWLLGSGMFGLAGFARRKKVA